MKIFIINIYIILFCFSSIKPVKVSPCARWKREGVTIASNKMNNMIIDEKFEPGPIFIHKKTNTLYWTDNHNNRIWKFQANQSFNTSSLVATTTSPARYIYVDDDNNRPTLYVSFLMFDHVEKWSDGASSGIQIGYECLGCAGVSVDKEKNVYMAAADNNRVIKWSPETNTTTVIAGEINQTRLTDKSLSWPRGIHVNQIDGSLYVADCFNSRIQKWSAGAKTGVTVAGSRLGASGRNAKSLYYPQDVLVDDETQTIYVADYNNYRVQRWLFNASKGETIAGTSSQGDDDDEFHGPTSLAFNNEGNLYVVDQYNYRIQMFTVIDNQPCPTTLTSFAESTTLSTRSAGSVSTTTTRSAASMTTTTTRSATPVSTTTTRSAASMTTTTTRSAAMTTTTTESQAVPVHWNCYSILVLIMIILLIVL